MDKLLVTHLLIQSNFQRTAIALSPMKLEIPFQEDYKLLRLTHILKSVGDGIRRLKHFTCSRLCNLHAIKLNNILQLEEIQILKNLKRRSLMMALISIPALLSNQMIIRYTLRFLTVESSKQKMVVGSLFSQVKLQLSFPTEFNPGMILLNQET